MIPICLYSIFYSTLGVFSSSMYRCCDYSRLMHFHSSPGSLPYSTRIAAHEVPMRLTTGIVHHLRGAKNHFENLLLRVRFLPVLKFLQLTYSINPPSLRHSPYSTSFLLNPAQSLACSSQQCLHGLAGRNARSGKALTWARPYRQGLRFAKISRFLLFYMNIARFASMTRTYKHALYVATGLRAGCTRGAGTCFAASKG